MIEKYKVIVKVGSAPGGQDRFLKYNTDDLLSFTKFLDRSYPDWRWFNVFNSNGSQIANFTSKSRPVKKQV